MKKQNSEPKIKILRAETKSDVFLLAKMEKGKISRMSYSNVNGHRITIVFK